MVIELRTTIILREDLYEKIVKESISRHGSVKKMSVVINELLSKHFTTKGVPESMFGSLKRFSLRDLRDEKEAH